MNVLVSCGEASGDLYAGALATELRQIDPSIRMRGFGGARLAEAGAELFGDYHRFAVTGIVDALAVLPRSWRMLRTLGEAARRERPDVFVAIDFPDFNFRLLPVMRRLGVPVVYYVSPQLWAWRPGRIDHLRRYVNQMLVIFPFEVPIYAQAGVPVEFVGHPLVELLAAGESRESWLASRGLDPTKPVVALLPGSRPNEIRRLLPVLLGAIPAVRPVVPAAQFVIARAPALSDDLFAAARAVPGVAMAEGVTDQVLSAADVVVTASGTATVQTALHDRPMVIVYRVSGLDAVIGRAVLRLSTFGMVNLIAGRTIVPELIQEACTPERVAEETVSLLTNAARASTMRRDLAAVRAALGGPGASARAAAAVARVVAQARASVKY